MSKVAFIGLGNMGRGMAMRLVAAGFDVSVYNRTPGKAGELVRAGAREATSPRDAVTGAEAIFSMVADDGASEQIWCGDEGIFAGQFTPGAVVVECSTLSHDWVLKLAEKAGKAGLKYVDSPVTGLPDAAAAGELVLFVGACDENLDEARRFLTSLCKQIMHFGDVGTGTAYKLIVNLMGAVQIAAAAEGLAMAEKAGLDVDQVVEAICTGQAAAPQVVRNVKRMAKAKHDTDLIFSGSMRLKDAVYGVQLAQTLGSRAGFGNLAAGYFQQLVDNGHGALNECKVIDVLRPEASKVV